MTGLHDPDHQISLDWTGPAPAKGRCSDQPREIWWSGTRNPVILLFSMENQGNLRNLPSSPGNFWKQRNLREFSGNGYGRFKCCFWECYVVFHMFCPQFPGKTTGKISHAPIHQGFIYVTYIYPWWIGEWPAYTPIMVFIFPLWKSVCVMLCYWPKIDWCHWCVLYV